MGAKARPVKATRKTFPFQFSCSASCVCFYTRCIFFLACQYFSWFLFLNSVFDFSRYVPEAIVFQWGTSEARSPFRRMERRKEKVPTKPGRRGEEDGERERERERDREKDKGPPAAWTPPIGVWFPGREGGGVVCVF